MYKSTRFSLYDYQGQPQITTPNYSTKIVKKHWIIYVIIAFSILKTEYGNQLQYIHSNICVILLLFMRIKNRKNRYLDHIFWYKLQNTLFCITMTKLIHVKFGVFCSKWKNLFITRKLYWKEIDKITTRQGNKILLFFSLIIFGKICRNLQWKKFV